jgi:hypothetical protein
MTPAEMRRFLKSLGITAADMRHFQNMTALCELLGENRVIPMLADEGVKAGDRWHRRTTRSLLATIRSAG